MQRRTAGRAGITWLVAASIAVVAVGGFGLWRRLARRATRPSQAAPYVRTVPGRLLLYESRGVELRWFTVDCAGGACVPLGPHEDFVPSDATPYLLRRRPGAIEAVRLGRQRSAPIIIKTPASQSVRMFAFLGGNWILHGDTSWTIVRRDGTRHTVPTGGAPATQALGYVAPGRILARREGGDALEIIDERDGRRAAALTLPPTVCCAFDPRALRVCSLYLDGTLDLWQWSKAGFKPLCHLRLPDLGVPNARFYEVVPVYGTQQVIFSVRDTTEVLLRPTPYRTPRFGVFNWHTGQAAQLDIKAVPNRAALATWMPD